MDHSFVEPEWNRQSLARSWQEARLALPSLCCSLQSCLSSLISHWRRKPRPGAQTGSCALPDIRTTAETTWPPDLFLGGARSFEAYPVGSAKMAQGQPCGFCSSIFDLSGLTCAFMPVTNIFVYLCASAWKHLSSTFTCYSTLLGKNKKLLMTMLMLWIWG